MTFSCSAIKFTPSGEVTLGVSAKQSGEVPIGLLERRSSANNDIHRTKDSGESISQQSSFGGKETLTRPALRGSVTMARVPLLSDFMGANGSPKSHKIQDVVVRSPQIQRRKTYTLHFYVRDTGIVGFRVAGPLLPPFSSVLIPLVLQGIPAERMDRLFKSFSQVDASTTRQYGGTGLGLAICKRLVEKMGGKIWVESKVGGGSTFNFTFPAAGTLETEIKTPRHLEETNFLRGKRVLVVDSSANRQALTSRFNGWKMETLSVASVQEALSVFATGGIRRWDLCILDVGCGSTQELLDFAGQLRTLEPNLPLVLLISLGKPTVELQDRRSGLFARILSKPVRTSRMFDTLMELLVVGPIRRKRASTELSPIDVASAIANGTGVKQLPIWDSGDGAGGPGPLSAGSSTTSPVIVEPPANGIYTSALDKRWASSGDFPNKLVSTASPTSLKPPGDGLLSATQQRGSSGPSSTSSQDWNADLSLRILVVDDNPLNVKIVMKMLERAGFTPDVATNGLEAVTAISNKVYDVVMMDIQMPIMDGFEATKRIRADLPKERQPRIIALTANALLNEREACLAAGMDHYLSKPIDMRKLADAIRECKRLPESVVLKPLGHSGNTDEVVGEVSG